MRIESGQRGAGRGVWIGYGSCGLILSAYANKLIVNTMRRITKALRRPVDAASNLARDAAAAVPAASCAVLAAPAAVEADGTVRRASAAFWRWRRRR